MQNTAHGRALSPDEMRHRRYLDALSAFSLTSGLFMEESSDDDGHEDGAGDGGGSLTKPRSERTPEEKGYPSGVPVENMTAERRANYWADQAKKHESMLKAERKNLGNITPADLAALREKASRHDALELELMSDKDKAVAEAKSAAANESRDKWLPRVVTAEFKAASAGRIDADRLAAILEPLDLSKFVDGDEVDADKVAAFIEGIAPKQDPNLAPSRRGPSASTAGPRTSTTAPSIDNGRSEYERRHGKKSA